jgi:hypothetical protein
MSNAKRKWSDKVKTVSTYPPEGLFTKDPATIARTLASKKVSPKGPASGMRMLNFFINRAGKNLSASRKAVLQKAKELLSERVKMARVGAARTKAARVGAARIKAARVGAARIKAARIKPVRPQKKKAA